MKSDGEGLYNIHNAYLRKYFRVVDVLSDVEKRKNMEGWRHGDDYQRRTDRRRYINLSFLPHLLVSIHISV